ncbi:hypothetical protein [Ramlibacter rhizophilus]|uniref:Uncharacterized protein n=1 Tax=Ramlibacter rhizophilus TaxID=1781167 RepID=A0A4Z0BHE9_9BURK|nr:hypothetical protein [Ramlibacter rhizophilus]TFY97338.1 hypothetical protein EZ242_17580 [Ramlibacter rhizophilus]
MPSTFRLSISSLIGALALTLSACGGGGGGGGEESAIAETTIESTAPDSTTPKAESPAGLWRGATDAGKDFTAFVLTDGVTTGYMIVYSDKSTKSVTGFVQDGAEIIGRTIRASNSLDYNFETGQFGVTALSGSVNDSGAFEGRLIRPTGPELLTANEYHSLEGTPTLAQVAGTYSGEFVGLETREAATIVITEAGEIVKTSASGCTASGEVFPDSKLNVYWISLPFDQTCKSPGWNDGIAYWDPKTAQLYVITGPDWDAVWGRGYVFIGAR